jgi:hypothetical protein
LSSPGRKRNRVDFAGANSGCCSGNGVPSRNGRPADIDRGGCCCAQCYIVSACSNRFAPTATPASSLLSERGAGGVVVSKQKGAPGRKVPQKREEPSFLRICSLINGPSLRAPTKTFRRRGSSRRRRGTGGECEEAAGGGEGTGGEGEEGTQRTAGGEVDEQARGKGGATGAAVQSQQQQQQQQQQQF